MNLFTWPTFLDSWVSPSSMTTRSLFLDTTLYGSVVDNLFCFLRNNSILSPTTSDSVALLFAASAPSLHPDLMTFPSLHRLWPLAAWFWFSVHTIAPQGWHQSWCEVLTCTQEDISVVRVALGFPSACAVHTALSNALTWLCRSTSPLALGHSGIDFQCLSPGSWLTRFGLLSVHSV